MENIQVIVRIRPQNQTERDNNDLDIWTVQQPDSITITNERFNDLVRMRKFVPGQRVEFTYNSCFDQKQQTYQLYKQQIQRIVLSSLQGINGTIFMYGQTGSGKTFTMMGTETTKIEQRDGLLPCALRDLFQDISQDKSRQYFLRCSYVEIYTDQVYDLLGTQERMTDVLQINEDYSREFVIKGAQEELVSSIDEIMEILRYGETNRHYASTVMNHCSSRSHTIFRLYVRCVQHGVQQVITESILNFVDLAGSEKINIHDKKRGTSAGSNPSQFKERQNESKHINKSLFFLTQVISLRSQGKSDLHIPYRNSPLTKILRSSLGGNSRTAVVLCVNPCYSQYEQTLSTLRFGINAKKIENNVQKNIISIDNDENLRIIDAYKERIKELEEARAQDRQAINRLKNQTSFGQDHLQELLKQPTYEWIQMIVPSAGIVWLPKRHKQVNHEPLIDSFEQIRRLQDASRKNQRLSEQVQLLEFQLQESNKKILDIQSQTKKRYSNQKMKTKKYKELSRDLQEKNSKLQKVANLYSNQCDFEDLRQLSNDQLNGIKNNIVVLLQNVCHVQANQGGRIEKTSIVKLNAIFFETGSQPIEYWESPTSRRSDDHNISEIDSFQSYFQSQHYQSSPATEVLSSVQNFREPYKHVCSHEKPSISHRVYKENVEIFKKNSMPEMPDEINFNNYFK